MKLGSRELCAPWDLDLSRLTYILQKEGTSSQWTVPWYGFDCVYFHPTMVAGFHRWFGELPEITSNHYLEDIRKEAYDLYELYLIGGHQFIIALPSTYNDFSKLFGEKGFEASSSCYESFLMKEKEKEKEKDNIQQINH